jgi:branched-chain amino acid transport system substrate-binding protein
VVFGEHTLAVDLAPVDHAAIARACGTSGIRIARAQNKVMLVNGAGTTELTGAQCSPNTIHWTWDTYMLAHASPAVVMGQGGDSWFFLGANYAFGHQLVQDASAVVTAGGGKVQGAVYYPSPGTVDFSSYLLQAQASGAKVLGDGVSHFMMLDRPAEITRLILDFLAEGGS